MLGYLVQLWAFLGQKIFLFFEKGLSHCRTILTSSNDYGTYRIESWIAKNNVQILILFCGQFLKLDIFEQLWYCKQLFCKYQMADENGS
jgi:hypothetical protein